VFASGRETSARRRALRARAPYVGATRQDDAEAGNATAARQGRRSRALEEVQPDELPRGATPRPGISGGTRTRGEPAPRRHAATASACGGVERRRPSRHDPQPGPERFTRRRTIKAAHAAAIFTPRPRRHASSACGGGGPPLPRDLHGPSPREGDGGTAGDGRDTVPARSEFGPGEPLRCPRWRTARQRDSSMDVVIVADDHHRRSRRQFGRFSARQPASSGWSPRRPTFRRVRLRPRAQAGSAHAGSDDAASANTLNSPACVRDPPEGRREDGVVVGDDHVKDDHAWAGPGSPSRETVSGSPTDPPALTCPAVAAVHQSLPGEAPL